MSTSKPKAPRINDSLFNYIEDIQCALGTPFGRFLDAGTGSHSLRWIAGLIHHVENENMQKKEKESPNASPLFISSYTAITADEKMRRTVLDEAKRLNIDESGDVLIGNWANKAHGDSSVSINDNDGTKTTESSHYLLDGQKYNTILADYLIGAMDGFSPYFQDQIFDRLSNHLNVGGHLYIVGLEPISDSITGRSPGDASTDIITRVAQVRDACILLAGHRCYREYPLTWVVRHVRKSGFEVVETKKFPIMYSHESISRQIGVGRSKLRFFKNEQLKQGMEELLDKLEDESKELIEKSSSGRIRFGFDYVVCAKRVN